MIGFYIGGVVATALLIAIETLPETEPGPAVYLVALVWPIMLPWFVIDAIRGRLS